MVLVTFDLWLLSALTTSAVSVTSTLKCSEGFLFHCFGNLSMAVSTALVCVCVCVCACVWVGVWVGGCVCGCGCECGCVFVHACVWPDWHKLFTLDVRSCNITRVSGL